MTQAAQDLRDQTRLDLQNDLFNELGTSIVLFVRSSTSVDKWGDSSSIYSSTTITGVPYNQGRVKNWEKYGDLNTDVLEMAVPYTVASTVNDIVFYDDVYYGVGEVAKYPLGGGNLVSTVVMYKYDIQESPSVPPQVISNFNLIDGNNFVFVSGDNFTFKN